MNIEAFFDALAWTSIGLFALAAVTAYVMNRVDIVNKYTVPVWVVIANLVGGLWLIFS